MDLRSTTILQLMIKSLGKIAQREKRYLYAVYIAVYNLEMPIDDDRGCVGKTMRIVCCNFEFYYSLYAIYMSFIYIISMRETAAGGVVQQLSEASEACQLVSLRGLGASFILLGAGCQTVCIFSKLQRNESVLSACNRDFKIACKKACNAACNTCNTACV